MNPEQLPFEVIQTWKPMQLKEFCRKWDLKAELVARIFAAQERIAKQREQVTQPPCPTLVILEQ